MIIKPSMLRGRVRVPSSKSIGHRLLICAGLADGISEVHRLTMSKDILATIDVLRKLGAEICQIQESENKSSCLNTEGEQVSVRVVGITDKNNEIECIDLNCCESGSTLRFLIPVGLTVKQYLRFNGEGRLKIRPIDEYFPILEKSRVEMTYNGELPITLRGSLKPGIYELSGSVSSQYTTGMLLAAPNLNGDIEITINGEMQSRGYLDLTLSAMNKFGVNVEREDYHKFRVKGDQKYMPAQVEVEGDYSQAAFWIVAGLIGHDTIEITGLDPESLQGDAVILNWVSKMGGSLEWCGNTLKIHPSRTCGAIIDVSQCPDLVPALCVLATQSEGETRIVNGERLRVKESDRIKATVSELGKLGAEIWETEDGMIIRGKKGLRGGCEVDGWNDHRIVMAMSIASTVCKEAVKIVGYEAIEKSYPNFYNDFQSLGGILE